MIDKDKLYGEIDEYDIPDSEKREIYFSEIDRMESEEEWENE